MGDRCGLFEIMSILEIMVILSLCGDGENDLYGDRVVIGGIDKWL